MTSIREPAEHPSEVTPPPRRLRCAIYTRKSTEDGLHQPFNTLEAQREAAEAYILSQRHVGWTWVPAQPGPPARIPTTAPIATSGTSAGFLQVVNANGTTYKLQIFNP